MKTGQLVFQFFLPTFIILYLAHWYTTFNGQQQQSTTTSLFQQIWSWFDHFASIGLMLIISWTFAYFLYERFNNEQIDFNPGNLSVLITGCDTGFGHELAIKLDNYGMNNIYEFNLKHLNLDHSFIH